VSGGTGRAEASVAAPPASTPQQATIEHRVRKGDTLHHIAQLYAVTVSQVRSWNRIGKEGTIYPGQVLRIYQQ
jgi:membrane-bound lytic murein transglycosylase D